MATAKANDTSSAFRNSFFFRMGRFCAIEEMTIDRPKSSGVPLVGAIRLTPVGGSTVDSGSGLSIVGPVRIMLLHH